MDPRLRGRAPLSTPLALRKHVRGYWTNILGGNDGVQREGQNKGSAIPQILTYCGQQLRKY